MNAGPESRPAGGEAPARAPAAHELRSSLNGIHTWAHVLEQRLGDGADPIVRRALDGIHAGVQRQAALIEALLEPDDPARR